MEIAQGSCTCAAGSRLSKHQSVPYVEDSDYFDAPDIRVCSLRGTYLLHRGPPGPPGSALFTYPLLGTDCFYIGVLGVCTVYVLRKDGPGGCFG